MSIEIHCENCHKRYRVKADLAGKRVRCANCGNPVTVPNGQATGDAGASGELHFAQDLSAETPPPVKRPVPPKAAPPPVPRQVVRFDPRFDPQSMSDIPAPPPPAAPARPAQQRAPQPARKNEIDSGRELHFADEDPLSIAKPKPASHDNLADTAAAPAISEDAPEPRLDQEPLIPRGKRGSGKLADTAAAAAPPSDEPDLDIPSDRPVFAMPSESTAMKKFRADQAAGKERKCTGCGATMKVGAVICLNCGFNAATGERGSAQPGDWEDSADGQSSGWSRLFGKADWKPEDRMLRRLCIFGVIICLFPLIGLKVPQLVKPGIYIAYVGLGLALLSAALFAKRMRITRAAVAAAAALISFAVYSSYRPLGSDDSLVRADDTPKIVPPRLVKTGDGRPKAGPTDAPTSEVAAILRGPGEGIDPVNWWMTYLGHADARVRFKSANYLIENTPAGRKEEVARAFENRLSDEHPQMRRLAIKGVSLYIDDHSTSVLTPLLKDEEEEVRADVYHLLAKLKDAKALPAIVARLSDDGTLAREALASFEASQKPAITRAFELSLKNDNPRQRELAARELANYAGPNTPGLLLGLLEDNDVGVRCAAVITLGKLKDPRTLDAILSRLSYDRAAAVAALEAFGSGAEKPVLSLLKTSANTEMRIGAAEILGSIGTKESIPALHDAALDSEQRLATTAKESWRKIAPDEFTPVMESAVDMESDSNTRQRAALERLCELKPDKNQDRVAKMLVRMAMSEDPVAREGAYKVLPTWGTKDTAPAFMEFLAEKVHPARRQLAELALGALKDPRGAPAVARWAVVDYPVVFVALADMGPVAEDSVIELLMNDRIDIRREAVKVLKMWGSKQKAVPSLLALLTKERELGRANLEKVTLEKDIIDAIQTIRERRDIAKKPVTQPNR